MAKEYSGTREGADLPGTGHTITAGEREYITEESQPRLTYRGEERDCLSQESQPGRGTAYHWKRSQGERLPTTRITARKKDCLPRESHAGRETVYHGNHSQVERLPDTGIPVRERDCQRNNGWGERLVIT